MNDRGSSIPLVLAFFLIALLVVGGSVALATAFVQQRDVQDVCDGAAAAAAATALDLGRSRAGEETGVVPFADATAVETAVQAYLERDSERRAVRVHAALSPDRATVTLTCREDRELPFGAMFGRETITHTATSSAQAPTRD